MSEDLSPISLLAFQGELERLCRWANHGCGDGSCQIQKPKGQQTNASCRCHPKEFAERLLYLACEVDKYEKYKKWNKEEPNDPKR